MADVREMRSITLNSVRVASLESTRARASPTRHFILTESKQTDNLLCFLFIKLLTY